MQQTQTQVVPTVAQPQPKAPVEIVILDDRMLSQVVGGVSLAAGPGGGW
jgi:hypothetical protein